MSFARRDRIRQATECVNALTAEIKTADRRINFSGRDVRLANIVAGRGFLQGPDESMGEGISK
jgi:hypothetical protein